jgi:hypothetical protein
MSAVPGEQRATMDLARRSGAFRSDSEAAGSASGRRDQGGVKPSACAFRSVSPSSRRSTRTDKHPSAANAHTPTSVPGSTRTRARVPRSRTWTARCGRARTGRTCASGRKRGKVPRLGWWLRDGATTTDEARRRASPDIAPSSCSRPAASAEPARLSIGIAGTFSCAGGLSTFARSTDELGLRRVIPEALSPPGVPSTRRSIRLRRRASSWFDAQSIEREVVPPAL